MGFSVVDKYSTKGGGAALACLCRDFVHVLSVQQAKQRNARRLSVWCKKVYVYVLCIPSILTRPFQYSIQVHKNGTLDLQ